MNLVENKNFNKFLVRQNSLYVYYSYFAGSGKIAYRLFCLILPGPAK